MIQDNIYTCQGQPTGEQAFLESALRQAVCPRGLRNSNLLRRRICTVSLHTLEIHGQPAYFRDSCINLAHKYTASFPSCHRLQVIFTGFLVWLGFLITSSFLQHPSGNASFLAREFQVFHSKIWHKNGSCVCTAVFSFQLRYKQIVSKP